MFKGTQRGEGFEGSKALWELPHSSLKLEQALGRSRELKGKVWGEENVPGSGEGKTSCKLKSKDINIAEGGPDKPNLKGWRAFF